MVKRGFVKKGDDSFSINIGFPSLKTIILLIILISIFMPWISIIARFNVLKKIINLFENLKNKIQMKKLRHQK